MYEKYKYNIKPSKYESDGNFTSEEGQVETGLRDIGKARYWSHYGMVRSKVGEDMVKIKGWWKHGHFIWS